MENWKFTPLKIYEPPAQPLPKTVDWKLGARAFDHWLNDFGLKAPYAGSVQVTVGLFGRAGELLRVWANMRSAEILEAPPAEALLDGTAELWPELQNPDDTIFVIPSLERCFLRHYRGIRLARQLVETAWARPCRLVIGCDAWAWKYLCHAVQIDSLCPDAITSALLMDYPTTDAPLPFSPRAKDSRTQAYVLHALLMHDGMSASVLPQLLPLRATEVLGALADLRERQLAFEEDGAWRVSPKHYAAIRQQLAAVEFWVG